MSLLVAAAGGLVSGAGATAAGWLFASRRLLAFARAQHARTRQWRTCAEDMQLRVLEITTAVRQACDPSLDDQARRRFGYLSLADAAAQRLRLERLNTHHAGKLYATQDLYPS